jgi:hypothetical protein
MGGLTFIFQREHRVRPSLAVLAWAYLAGKEPQRCAIVNYTAEGACVSSADQLPDAFTLRVIDSTTERLCVVVWRDDGLVGVRYVNVRTRPRLAEDELSYSAGS